LQAFFSKIFKFFQKILNCFVHFPVFTLAKADIGLD